MTNKEAICQLDTIWKKYTTAYDFISDEDVESYDTAVCALDRRIGKWIKVSGYATPGGDPVWCCSECGKGLHVYGVEHGTYGADISDGQWVACPNCGAIMEGS